MFHLVVLFGQNEKLDSIKNSIDLDQVVISVSKTPESMRKVVTEVRVIDQRKIKLLQAQTTADLLQADGGVFIQRSQQGGGSTVLRGFEANRVLLMIDGVRMNNAIYRGGHLQNVLSIDNNTLERVEVLYGPSSTTYGSDALGGVIHFYTKKPIFSASQEELIANGNIFGRVSSANNERTGHLDFGIGGKKLASFTSFTYSSFGDLVMGKRTNPSFGQQFGTRPFYQARFKDKDSIVMNADSFKQVGSAYNQYDFIQKLSYTNDNKNIHGLNFQYSNTNDIPRYDRLTDPSASTRLNQAEWYYGPQKRIMLAYDFEHNVGFKDGNNSFQFNANYQDIEESRHNRRFNAARLSSRIENLSVLGFSAGYARKESKSITSFGIDGQFNDLESKAFSTHKVTGEVLPIDTRYPDGDNKFNQMGLYANQTLDFNSKWSMVTGGRVGFSALNSTFISKQFFDFPFSEISQNNFTYSNNLGVSFRPSINTKIAFGLATGFRSPNIDDLAKVFESVPGTIIVPNADLKPEQTNNYDLSITHYFTNKIRFEATGYYTDIIDAIVTDNFTFNGQSAIEYRGRTSRVLASQNKGKAFITGYSSKINVDVIDHLSIDGSMMYTYGRVKGEISNTPLDHIPPVVLRGGLNYRNNRMNLTFFMLHNGWKKIEDYLLTGEDNAVYATPKGMPAWTTFNLKGDIVITKNLDILFGIENITDLQYRTFSSGINSPGRNFSVTIKGKI